MTDDGKTVRLTQREYDEIVGRIHRLFSEGPLWDFPWQGPRAVYVVPGDTVKHILGDAAFAAGLFNG